MEKRLLSIVTLLLFSLEILTRFGYVVECSCDGKVWRKLNDNKVCFGAADGSHGSFTSGFNMNLYKIKYVRRSGYLSCEVNSGGYFGCEPFPFGVRKSGKGVPATTTTTTNPVPAQPQHVHHYYHYIAQGSKPHHVHHGYYGHQTSNSGSPTHHSNTGHYYKRHEGYYSYDEAKQNDEGNSSDPSKQTSDNVVLNDSPNKDEKQASEPESPQQDTNFIYGPGPPSLQGVSVFLTDSSGALLVPKPPCYGSYFQVLGVNRPAWKPEIMIPIAGSPIGIQRGMSMRVYHGEDLRNIDNLDNTGNLCIDIYGYGTMSM